MYCFNAWHLPWLSAATAPRRQRDNDEMDEVTFSSVAPVIAVRDLDRALRRYRMLGFSTRAYDGPDRYGFVERNGVELHLSEAPENDRTRGGAEIYLYVSDSDALYTSWSSSGVKGRFIPPHDTPYGLREFAFVDRDGTAHRVGSPLPPS
jgi:glyoxalase/bleomycin resistance protein/dioxygenase superfamily protein